MKNRAVYHLIVLGCAVGAGLVACATLPEPKVRRHLFPRNAYVGDVQRPYTVLGPVRSKVDYISLDSSHEERDLCKNYYNKAVRELLGFAKKQGGDAVVDVQSVVFLADGRRETYKTPECSDDGAEGQVLTQGIAVRWKSDGAGAGAWTQPMQPSSVRPLHLPQAAAKLPAPLKPQPVVAPPPPAMPLGSAVLYEPPELQRDQGYESVPMSVTQPLTKPIVTPESRSEYLPASQDSEPMGRETPPEQPLSQGVGFADPRNGPVIR